MNRWLERIDWMLEQHPKESQRKYLASVQNQIERYPALYPTLPQELILARLWRHYKRLERESVLGTASECYGR
jgi:hypothetical protein